MATIDQDRLRRAEAHVDAQIGFYLHLAAYIVVTGILVLINYMSGGPWWAQWPAMGWGLGILGHAIGVFGRMPAFVTAWRLRKIHAIEKQMQGRPAGPSNTA